MESENESEARLVELKPFKLRKDVVFAESFPTLLKTTDEFTKPEVTSAAEAFPLTKSVPIPPRFKVEDVMLS